MTKRIRGFEPVNPFFFMMRYLPLVFNIVDEN